MAESRAQLAASAPLRLAMGFFTRFMKNKERRSARLADEVLAPLRLVMDQLWASLATHDFESGAPVTIMVAGVEGGVGTTTVAACTASGLARHLKLPTVLFELGVGTLRAATLFGLASGPSAEELAAKVASFDDAVRRVGNSPLHVLAAFNTERRRGSALPAIAAVDVIETLAQRFRIIVIDAPPLLESAVARHVLPHATKAVLVLRANRSRLAAAEQAVEFVRKSRVELAGIVLNRFKKEAPAWLLPSKWDS
ncbi:MAG: hypothetical protein L0Z55_00480 [Planctomycetes bacterium]|nr:hypothetical protein [Planctomycetota bacterium]